MKAFTDLEQSKKLAEILPLESADMYYHYITSVVNSYYEEVPKYVQLFNHFVFFHQDVPCWSLAALLNVIPNYKLSSEHNYHTCTAETSFGKETVGWFDNPIDACVAMIEKLHERKML